MTLPTHFGNGTAFSLGVAGSANWPAGHQADDIGILVVETARQTMAVPSGWTEVTGSPQGTGTVGAAGSTQLHVFWRRAVSGAEAAATIADSGDHQMGRILVFRGCETSGDPWDTSAGDVEPSAVTAISVPGGTTSVADCLVLLIATNATDTAASEFSGISNADLANLATRTSVNNTSNLGGGYYVGTGEKAVAGAFGATSVTLVTASAQARLMLALKPPAVGGGGGGGSVPAVLLTEGY